jgi:hypothetical protein
MGLESFTGMRLMADSDGLHTGTDVGAGHVLVVGRCERQIGPLDAYAGARKGQPGFARSPLLRTPLPGSYPHRYVGATRTMRVGVPDIQRPNRFGRDRDQCEARCYV